MRLFLLLQYSYKCLYLSMFDRFDKYMLDIAPFTSQELNTMHSFLQRQTVNKKEFLLMQGEVCRFEAFIVKGCLKKYYIDEEGNESIVQFAIEDWWISDINSYNFRSPAQLFIEAIETTHLMLIKQQDKEELYRLIPKLERVFRLMFQRAYAVLEQRFYSSATSSAEERYLQFVQRYPSIIQRVPQLQIASYLGVTPESLSRIKTSLLKRKER